MMTRRTRNVWIAFGASMTAVVGVLWMGDRGLGRGFLMAEPGEWVAGADVDEPVGRLQVPIRTDQWQGIVIHDLGLPAGDAESVTRLHRSMGFSEEGGMGYHFLIGNGNGLGDGIIYAGNRWCRQLPGAHVAGPNGAEHNLRSIGICLVGNGDRRPFTDAQVESLVLLIGELQQRLDLAPGSVHLARDLVAEESSPGRYFPVARVDESLPGLIATPID